MRPDIALPDPGPLRPLLEWVDDRFGPIRRLEGSFLLPPHPRWCLYACDLSRTPPGTWFLPYPSSAAGLSLDPVEALRRALGEAVERYSGMFPPDPAHCFPLAPRENELTRAFPRCALDEPCAPALRELNPGLLLTHVRVRRLSDGATVAVPASAVHLAFAPRSPEPLTTESVSTGLAFHTERHRAIWSGLCEVAERDAVMLTWWTRRSAPRIDADNVGVPNALAERLARLRRAGLRTHLFDVSTDFRVPAVLCLLLADRFPYAGVGAACAADPLAACTKAIDEAVYIRVCFAKAEPAPSPSDAEPFAWVRTLDDHGRLYASWKGSPAFDFLLRSADDISYAELAAHPWWRAPADDAELAERARALEAMGLTVLWTDVTTPEARGIGHVVKVVVPEMVPLPHDHRARWFATPRLLRLSGLSATRCDAFNPYPQPLA